MSQMTRLSGNFTLLRHVAWMYSQVSTLVVPREVVRKRLRRRYAR